MSETLISFGPRREAFLIRRARCLDDVWTAMSSTARELGLCVSTMVPRPPQFLLEGPSGHSMEVPTHVESFEACAGFVPETTGSSGGAELVEPLLSSLQSNDQDAVLLPSAPEDHRELSKDDDIGIPFDDLMEMM
ncbi:hypothetical protein Taro_017691 [Colocasia esculenta]|uniref:Uncharacterized protein n=1 Tax=Colocasia esculenta TaxID=4460 RepID=A0A843UU17_COLES|nr:hypothetical protein [Colocasia esculenta]